MWKSWRFSGKLSLPGSKPAHDQGSQPDSAAYSAMASPSPHDRCWIVKDSSSSLPILPAVRAAVQRHWLEIERAATAELGDGNLATEIMEGAIEQAVAYLADHPPRDQDDVSAVLSRFCRQEVSRRRKERNQFIFIDSIFASETPWSYTPFSAADAAIDVERILSEAPPKVREAMLMRYGSSESWNDVATRTASTPDAIRVSCKRFIERVRQKLGIAAS
jgi:DNA-directed RNA polymerase specialized sigma24 family protein